MAARKRGGILNIASIVAFQAIPYWTTYAATKAFVLAFGEGLAYELRDSGVRVVTVCPGFTKTGLYADSGVPGMAGRLLPFATPEQVVRVALAAYDAGRVVRVVGLTNRLLAISGALTPRFILRWLMAKMFAPTTAGAGSSGPPSDAQRFRRRLALRSLRLSMQPAIKSRRSARILSSGGATHAPWRWHRSDTGTARGFFDTGVLLYLLSEDSNKADRVEDLLAERGTISVQVLNEFTAVALRKLRMPLSDVREILGTVRAVCSVEPVTLATHERGLEINERYGFALYDSMIVASALIAGGRALYAEDLQHGQVIDAQLRVVNPFLRG